MKRAKSQDGADQFALGTSVGVQSILQAVSALEQRRFDDEHSWSRTQHPEAHVSLRNDKRIRTLEAGARQREAQRVDKAQKLKAAGSTAGMHAVICGARAHLLLDTYTQLQLRDVALHGLRSPTTTAKLEIETRDRAMLLLSTQMATRGEIVRSFLLSDMFLTLVDNPAAGDGKVLPVSARASQPRNLCSVNVLRFSPSSPHMARPIRMAASMSLERCGIRTSSSAASVHLRCGSLFYFTRGSPSKSHPTSRPTSPSAPSTMDLACLDGAHGMSSWCSVPPRIARRRCPTKVR